MSATPIPGLETTAAPDPALAQSLASADPAPRTDTPHLDNARSLFDVLADRIIDGDGGVLLRPKGGARFGVTPAMLADWLNRKSGQVTADELADITADTARAILFERFWRPLGCDRLPEPVAALLFDVAVRRGVERAGKMLQKAASTASGVRLKVDGLVGPLTHEAVAKIDGAGLAEHLLAGRSTFAMRLGDGKIFGRSWNVQLARAVLFAGKLALKRGV